jgi:tetratricopeptide (TPR) repeat protein
VTAFVPALDRAEGLPGEVGALLELSDRLVAGPATSPHSLDRSLAALEHARTLPGHDAFEIHWRDARAATELARLLPSAPDRLRFLARARGSATLAMANEDRVEGFYYLALAIALEAEITQNMELVKPLVVSAEMAVALDKSYDGAAPLQLLGKIYLEAPEWPTSVGDKERAVALLEQAVSIAPSALSLYFLGEALFHDEQPERARASLVTALSIRGDEALAPRWRTLAAEYLEGLQVQQ